MRWRNARENFFFIWDCSMPPTSNPNDPSKVLLDQIEKLINDNDVMIFSKSWCPFCKKVREILFVFAVIVCLAFDLDQTSVDISKNWFSFHRIRSDRCVVVLSKWRFHFVFSQIKANSSKRHWSRKPNKKQCRTSSSNKNTSADVTTHWRRWKKDALLHFSILARRRKQFRLTTI